MVAATIDHRTHCPLWCNTETIESAGLGGALTHIKICRLKDYKRARAIAWQGADYLGFHFVECGDLRPDNPLVAINRQLVRRDGFTGGVMLTRTARFEDVREVLEDGEFHLLQIHCSYSVADLQALKSETSRRGVEVIAVVDPTSTPLDTIKEINAIADYILVDHIKGGTGQPVDERLLKDIPMDRCFLAGGLDFENVAEKVARFKPYSIDVQTDTERKNTKEKDLQRTHNLIKGLRESTVRYPRTTASTSLGLSITRQRIVEDQIAQRLRTEADVIHVDLVDATAYPEVPGASHADLQSLTTLVDPVNTAICDLHIFANDSSHAVMQFNAALEHIREPRVCYLHVREPVDLPLFQSSINHILQSRVRPGVAFTCDANSARGAAQLVANMRRCSVYDVLLIGPSSRDATSAEYVDAVNKAIEAFSLAGEDLTLALDRGVSLEVLNDLHVDQLASINIGGAIWDAADPIKTFEEVRTRLANS